MPPMNKKNSPKTKLIRTVSAGLNNINERQKIRALQQQLLKAINNALAKRN